MFVCYKITSSCFSEAGANFLPDILRCPKEASELLKANTSHSRVQRQDKAGSGVREIEERLRFDEPIRENLQIVNRSELLYICTIVARFRMPYI